MDLVTPTANVNRHHAGAINFYVVNGIDDTTAHAYEGGPTFVNPPPWVIFEDTGWLGRGRPTSRRTRSDTCSVCTTSVPE
jgi:hypothetical protein